MEAVANSVDDALIDSLSFKLSNSASYLTDRKSVTFWPTGSNIYKTNSGTKVIRFVLTHDNWLDPSTVRLMFNLVNNYQHEKSIPKSSTFILIPAIELTASTSQITSGYFLFNNSSLFFSIFAISLFNTPIFESSAFFSEVIISFIIKISSNSYLCTKLVDECYKVTAVDILKYEKNSLAHLFSKKNFTFLKLST